MGSFDAYSSSYNELLDDTLEKFGSDSSFFAQRKVEIVLENTLEIETPRILEIGCGIGNNLIILDRCVRCEEIVGIDISQESIEKVNMLNLKKTKVLSYDGRNIPFEEDSFDVVIIANVLHHIERKNHKEFLKEVYRVLKGKIFIFEHNTLNPVTRSIFNSCPFDKDAEMLSFSYANNILRNFGFSSLLTRFIHFIPPRLDKLLFVEKYLTKLPLGAQYYILGEK